MEMPTSLAIGQIANVVTGLQRTLAERFLMYDERDLADRYFTFILYLKINSKKKKKHKRKRLY